MISRLSHYYWPFIRISGLLLIAPVLGDGRVPVRIRISLCIALTLVISPLLDNNIQIELLSGVGFLMGAMQLLIGIAIGFMLRLVFATVAIAGESVATLMGLGYALINDPVNGVQVPIVSQFYSLFVTLLFLAFDGHHALILVLVDSFEYIPVGALVTRDMLWQVVELSGFLFSAAIQMGLPALAALLTVNIVMGIMTRTSPALNLFSIGFPVTTMLGFLVLIITLPLVADVFTNRVSETFTYIESWLRQR